LTALPALEVSGLRKAFGRTVAVDGVAFAVRPGGALGLVGESGSGKTTVARIIAGLLPADAGEVRVQGEARAGHAARRAERLARAREVQIVFQDPYLSLDPRRAAADTLGEVLRLHGHRDPTARRARVAELLEQVGLGLREGRAMPRELSGGQRQRVAIARALACEPRVLLLDEAVAALDVSIQAQILELLARVREDTGVAYVFISHDLAVVRHVSDDVAVMYRGRIVETGPTASVLDAPADPYTRLLLASVPRRGWDPSAIARARRELQTA
jgi:ABC-type glutathione transport system ATPase component